MSDRQRFLFLLASGRRHGDSETLALRAAASLLVDDSAAHERARTFFATAIA